MGLRFQYLHAGCLGYSRSSPRWATAAPLEGGANLQINTAWCVAATITADLLCWLQLLCLARSLADPEPKTLRYRILHTAVRIVRGHRKRKIKTKPGPGSVTCTPRSWPRSPSPNLT